MNRFLRRGYVESLGVALVLVLAWSGWRAATGEPAALLAAAAWAVPVGLVAGSKIHVARHAGLVDRLARAVTVGLVVAAAVLGAWPAAAIGVVALGGLLGYQLWYARQHHPDGPLRVGEPLPVVPLQRPDGTATTTAELVGRPQVLVFYRGSWCPFCVAQVRELAAQYRELDRRGVGIALVSPQPAADTRELAERFEVPMSFYVDAGGAAARMLDLLQAGGVPLAFDDGVGDTVVPSVIITDAAGRVVWVDHSRDHRVRPEPSTFLEVIDREGIAVAG